MREIILISITGQDRTGLTQSLSSVLARYRVNILDISQSVIHKSLSLGLMIEVPKESESSPILKDLLYAAHNLDVSLTFTPIEPDQYETWVQAQGKKRYILTLLGRVITAEAMATVAGIIHDNGLNIDFMTRLTGRTSFVSPDSNPRACIELSLRGTPRDLSGMHSRFLDISRTMGVDIGLQEDDMFRRNRRLIAFDMDSTLIQVEVIDELAKAAGVGDQVVAITESAMRGEIDFKESLTRRVALLEGLQASVLEEIAHRLPLTEGAHRLIATLKKLGYKVAILSGGFTYFGNHLQKLLGVDYVFANDLAIRDGRLTGKIQGEIVDGPGKANLLREIAKQEALDLNQVIAVGDGANDLPMLDQAGLGIAFHAKPVVRQGAGQAISNLGLDAILYFIGIRDREAAHALNAQ
ncbi:phosphoserine phosphatase SerB [Desulfoplanes sp.]